MKKIKRLLILLLVIVLSGCTVQYDLTINSDLSVNEKVIANEYTKRMNVNTGLNTSQSVNYLYNMFNREGLDSKISTENKNTSTIATVTASHNTLEDYVISFSSDVVEEVGYKKDGDLVTLNFKQTEGLSSKSSRSLIYNEIRFNLIVPFKVIKCNSDHNSRNTYSWVLKEDEKLKDMSITFDTSNLKYGKRLTIGNKKYDVKYSYIILGGFLLVIVGIVCIVFINNKKHNKI